MEPENIKLKEIKPVLTGYINKSHVLLKQNIVPGDDAVHDIRVLMKKSRAILRLISPLLANELQSKDIQSLKRVGQIMSEWRDTSVQRKTLKELKKEFPSIFAKLEGNEKLVLLMKKPELISEPDEIRKNGIDEIDDLLIRSGYRIRFQQLQGIDPVNLLRELETSHKNVTDIYLKCRNRERTRPEDIHEFRKRSKDFLYQLFFFRPLNPQAVKSVEKRLERMTMYLGRYNDLYQLIKVTGYNYSGESTDPVMDELIIKIREKQDNYLSKVWPTAYKCLCPGTKLANLLGFKILML